MEDAKLLTSSALVATESGLEPDTGLPRAELLSFKLLLLVLGTLPGTLCGADAPTEYPLLDMYILRDPTLRGNFSVCTEFLENSSQLQRRVPYEPVECASGKGNAENLQLGNALVYELLDSAGLS